MLATPDETRRTRPDDDAPKGVVMGSFIQIIGAVLVLAGFVLAQRGVLTHTCGTYLVLNLIGSAVLAGDALLQRQWGFLLLESVWAVVSAAGLVVNVHNGASPRRPRHRV